MQRIGDGDDICWFADNIQMCTHKRMYGVVGGVVFVVVLIAAADDDVVVVVTIIISDKQIKTPKTDYSLLH